MRAHSLVDSSFLYALFAEGDPNHQEAQALAQLIGGKTPLILLPLQYDQL
jgi:predicted nucleic acid-binding protein